MADIGTTTPSIPLLRGPSDALAAGPNASNLAAAARQRHPIDRLQRGEERDRARRLRGRRRRDSLRRP